MLAIAIMPFIPRYLSSVDINNHKYHQTKTKEASDRTED